MIPDTYHGRDDESDQPDPADWPLGKPGRPYGIEPSPALGIQPWMTAEDVANMPRRQLGHTLAEAATNRAAYINRLRLRRDIPPAGPTADGASPAGPPRPGKSNATAPAAEQSPQPAPAQSAESAAPAAPPASPAVAESVGPSRPPSPAAAEAKAKAAATAGPGQPRPLLRRQERFCIAYLLGGNASRAAWDAGYTSGNSANQGYRLLKRPEIQARIAELQRSLGRGFAGDAEALLGKLEAIYQQAIEGTYFNAAVRVVELQARIAGRIRSKATLPPELRNDEK